MIIARVLAKEPLRPATDQEAIVSRLLLALAIVAALSVLLVAQDSTREPDAPLAGSLWQIIAAVGTVGAVWFAARRDASRTRSEFQQSVEEAIAPLARSVETIQTDVRDLTSDVAFLRGRQEERDRSRPAAPSTPPSAGQTTPPAV